MFYVQIDHLWLIGPITYHISALLYISLLKSSESDSFFKQQRIARRMNHYENERHAGL